MSENLSGASSPMPKKARPCNAGGRTANLSSLDRRTSEAAANGFDLDDEDAPEEYEAVYADGSLKNECWKSD